MSYIAAIQALNALVPELFTAPGRSRRKFSLDEIRVLLAALGNPQLHFDAVLIAGTNGKGSTAATLASILHASGVPVGLFTSPHLTRVNERMVVNGEEIPDDCFARLFFRVRDQAASLVEEGSLPQFPSFFEILTAMAFLFFAETCVQIAVLEVGMGGRLDATNVVEPVISVITDISLDHTEWLGWTISAITREKAGILRRGGTLITLPQHPVANQTLGEVAQELDVRGVSAADYMPPLGVRAEGPYSIEILGESVVVDSPLIGTHQHRNLALAIAAAVELESQRDLPITSEAISKGIHETRWPGRLERISFNQVSWILDVAHNPGGAWALRSGIGMMAKDGKPMTLVFSCLGDKPVNEMAQILFPVFDHVIFAPIHSARAASMDSLRMAAQNTGTRSEVVDSVSMALRRAEECSSGGVVVVSGSVYLVGEARSLLMLGKANPS